MKKLIIAGLVLTVLFFACSKDKYKDTPQISLKSVDPSVVPVNGNLDIRLSYTDKQGDISDTLYIAKTRLNQTATTTLRDSIHYKIPDFPDYDKGDIDINLNYQNDLVSAATPPPIVGSNPSQPQPDTLLLKIWISDKAGHISDTVSTKVVIMR